MGRKARLRKERKSSTSSTKQIAQPQDNSVLARASSLVKQPQATPDEPTSWSDKVLDWINPFPKVDKYQASIEASEFEQENEVLIAAIAWEGFEQHGRGLVLLEQRPDEPITFQYISRLRLKKKMKKHGVEPEDIQTMSDLIKTYQPSKQMLAVYVNREGKMSTSISTPKESSPPECYQMLKGEKQN